MAEKMKYKEVKKNWTARDKLKRSSQKFDQFKKLYDKEMQWTLMSLSFNPLWPSFNRVFETTITHFMFFHDLFKNVRKLGIHNEAMEHWAKAKCFEVTCSRDIK